MPYIPHLYTLHHTPYTRKIALKCDFSCTSANCIVPLHREPALGMSAHQRRRVADIIKRRLLALVLEHWNPAKFRNPKQESGKCPLVCLIRCVPQRGTYRRGHSLFILVTGSCRNLNAENKQKEVPRFFYIYTNGAFGANFPQN